jgi:hypothetical protein
MDGRFAGSLRSGEIGPGNERARLNGILSVADGKEDGWGRDCQWEALYKDTNQWVVICFLELMP